MPGSGTLLAGVVALLVALAFLLVGAVPAGAHSPSARSLAFASQPLPTASDPTWSNGVLRVDFVGAAPVFTVQSISDSRISMGQTLYGLAELNASGGVVSLAPFTGPGVAWSFQSQATPTGITVTMASNLTVSQASGNWEAGDDSNEDGSSTIGTTHVTVKYFLNSSSSATAWTVAYTLNISAWPWSDNANSLGLQVNSTRTQSGTLWTHSSSNSISVQSASSTIATFSWGTGAQVHYSDGTASQSAVETDQNQSRWNTQSFVRLDFGSVSGGYSNLEYDPWITLNPSAFKLASWAFTPATLEVSGGAAALVAILAGVAVARQRKSTRSDL